jgi:integrase
VDSSLRQARDAAAYGRGWSRRWSDVDLDSGTLTISRALERIRDGAGVYAEPKTATSLRSLTVEADAVALLLTHRERQQEEKADAGAAYVDEGLIFCTRLGRPLSRFNVTRDFKQALRRAGLAPVRFHDLRHTSATLMLIAGVHLNQIGARRGRGPAGATPTSTPRPSTPTSSGGSTARRPGASPRPAAPGRVRFP